MTALGPGNVAAGESGATRDPFLAFIVDDATRAVVGEAADSLLFAKETVKAGTVVDARSYLEQARSPRLLLVDIDGVKDPVSEINHLGDVCELGTKLLAVGSSNDVELFRDLLRIGATDYLVKPITVETLVRTLSASVDQDTVSAAGRLGKLVSVVGVRGGVGSSMLVANLGWIIAEEKERRCALIDLDTHFGNLGLLLDVQPRGGLADALQRPERIDGLFLERVLSRRSDRLFVLTSEERLSQVVFGQKAAIDALFGELRSKFHYVVADLPRQPSPIVHRVIQLSSVIIVVTEMTLASLRDSIRMLALIREMNPGATTLVVANRIGEYKRGELPQAEFERGLGRAIDFKIPFDASSILEASNLGKPVASKRGVNSAVLGQIADRLINPGTTAKKVPLLKRLLR